MVCAYSRIKVIAPATPYDAKGMLVAAVRDNNPVVMLEHRWLHNTVGPVPKEIYEVFIKSESPVKVKTFLVAYSYMLTEAMVAAQALHQKGIDIEVIDAARIAHSILKPS